MNELNKNKKSGAEKNFRSRTNMLRNTNFVFTFFIIFVNVLSFLFCDSNKNTFFILSTIFNVFLFFLYRFCINSLIKSKWYLLKNEIMYVNYPVRIFIGFGILCAILVTNMLIIRKVNEAALNIAFSTAFFINTVIILIPSILFLIYMFLLMPAFIIPSYEIKRNKKSDKYLFVIFIIFLLSVSVKFIFDGFFSPDFIKRDKFKIAKMVFSASDDFLKYTDLSEVTEENLKESELEIPFLYTVEGFPANSYYIAESFCDSIGAKVATHKEIYNIIFNRFDLFGEKYYWTSDTAGKNRLLLHFKNMNYEIVKATGNEKPVVYCTSSYNRENKGVTKYFYKTPVIDYGTDEKDTGKTSYSTQNDNMNYNTGDGYNTGAGEYGQPPVDVQKSGFVNFTIKHVSPQYLNEMINKGYNYSFEPPRRQDMYSQGSYYSTSRMLKENSEIRLCYFPFIDYENFSVGDEVQIWQQNFCYPRFETLSVPPAFKTRYEKDAYCMANGGRLPNIAELVAILKLNNEDIYSYKFWTNINIASSDSGLKNPVAITFAKDDLVVPEIIREPREQAVAYCVKNPKTRPGLISNFKSHYAQYDGSYYAKSLCYNCKYYEMPDMVAD